MVGNFWFRLCIISIFFWRTYIVISSAFQRFPKSNLDLFEKQKLQEIFGDIPSPLCPPEPHPTSPACRSVLAPLHLLSGRTTAAAGIDSGSAHGPCGCEASPKSDLVHPAPARLEPPGARLVEAEELAGDSVSRSYKMPNSATCFLVMVPSYVP